MQNRSQRHYFGIVLKIYLPIVPPPLRELSPPPTNLMLLQLQLQSMGIVRRRRLLLVQPAQFIINPLAHVSESIVEILRLLERLIQLARSFRHSCRHFVPPVLGTDHQIFNQNHILFLAEVFQLRPAFVQFQHSFPLVANIVLPCLKEFPINL